MSDIKNNTNIDIETIQEDSLEVIDIVESEIVAVLDSRISNYNYPMDKNPARTYISSLATTGKLPQESALRAASMIIAGIQPDVFPWH